MIQLRQFSFGKQPYKIAVLAPQASTVWLQDGGESADKLEVKASGVDFISEMLSQVLSATPQLTPTADGRHSSQDRLFHLDEKPSELVPGKKVWRISKERELVRSPQITAEILPHLELANAADVLVAALDRPGIETVLSSFQRGRRPRWFVAIATQLTPPECPAAPAKIPAVAPPENPGIIPPAPSDTLAVGAAEQTNNVPVQKSVEVKPQPQANSSLLICDVPAIRRAGGRLREDNAVEALVVDVLEYLATGLDRPSGGPSFFHDFQDIVIRLRLDAILHLHKRDEPILPLRKIEGMAAKTELAHLLTAWDATLVYTATAADYLKLRDQGTIIGCRSIIATSLLEDVEQRLLTPEKIISHDLQSPLRAAMQRCLSLYHWGYPALVAGSPGSWGAQIWRHVTLPERVQQSLPEQLKNWQSLLDPADPQLGDLKKSLLRPQISGDSKKATKACSLELKLLGRWWGEVSRRSEWSLLKETLFRGSPAEVHPWSDFSQEERRFIADKVLTLSRTIAKNGIEVDDPSLRTLTVGKLVAIEREDIDNISSVQRLLRHFREDASLNKPFSLAVFGAPGSGKSFGVKEAAKGFPRERGGFHDPILEFNVAQFCSRQDLAKALHQVRDICLNGYIPIAFFDEFDASFEGRRFGWLKYFLMPMQDGQFRDGEGVHNVGRAFFIFAGGVNLEYSEFSGRVRDPEFCDAKGPDFLSRLRGFYNVPSLNRRDDDPWNLHMIRRALLLDSFRKMHLPAIDDFGLLRAFLEVPSFRHGARSMQAILEMSSPNRDHKVDRSSLPRRDQLDIHVDPREFRDLVDRYPASLSLSARGRG